MRHYRILYEGGIASKPCFELCLGLQHPSWPQLAWRCPLSALPGVETIKYLLPGNIIVLKCGYMLCRLIFYDGCWSTGRSFLHWFDTGHTILITVWHVLWNKGWMIGPGRRDIHKVLFFQSPASSLLLNWDFSLATASQQLLLIQD